jgi:hypothetical protein
MPAVFSKSFSSSFGIDPNSLIEYGCFDPYINMDTKLFIDPLLIGSSKFEIIRDQGFDAFKEYFSKYIKLLMASDNPGDIAERNARRLLKFKEIPYTCIGYGSESTRGAGWGPDKQSKFLSVSRQVLKLGMSDPDIFPLLGILESGIGPDLISDMTTNIIINQLCQFTSDTCEHFNIPVRSFKISPRATFKLPENADNPGKPIILVPQDILRDIPSADSWGDVYDLASQTDEIRNEVNSYLGKIFRETVKDHKEKIKIKSEILQNKEALDLIVQLLKEVNKSGYNFKDDPKGILLMKRLFEVIPKHDPIDFESSIIETEEDLISIATKICDQFVFLIEKRGYWKELYIDGKPASESKLQKLFYVVSSTYCKELDVDVNSESETGDGRIDFKLSKGYTKKVIIELKWSSNNNLVKNYANQTKLYAESEETNNVFYMVVDSGHPKRIENLFKKKREMNLQGVPAPGIIIADSTTKEAPSKS